MKTASNITELKSMLNANEDNALNIVVHGAVVKEFPFTGNSREFKRVEKVNGRYYFIDTMGTRYAFNKFANLEALCEEFLERMADDINAVVGYFMTLKEYGRVTIRFSLSSMFQAYCQKSGVNVAYVENSCQCVHNGNELYTIETYEISGGEDSPKSDNEPKDETTTGEAVAHVDNITVDNCGLGHWLYYEINGVAHSVTGEFYIDKHNILHHTHICDNGNEIEIKAQL